MTTTTETVLLHLAVGQEWRDEEGQAWTLVGRRGCAVELRRPGWERFVDLGHFVRTYELARQP